MGYLKGGLRSLESRPDLTASTERVSPRLAAQFVSTDELTAVDVRAPREREQKRIARSLAIPLNHLLERVQELPTNRPLLLYCAGGYRSSIAASLLERQGFNKISELAGGLAAWETASLPLATGT